MFIVGCFSCCVCWCNDSAHDELINDTPYDALRSIIVNTRPGTAERGQALRCAKTIIRLKIKSWSDLESHPAHKWKGNRNFGEQSFELLRKLAIQRSINLPSWSVL